MQGSLPETAPAWRTALLLGLIATVIYGLFAWERLRGPSTDPHFILLAEAWLGGQLELRTKPPHQNDWASYQELTLADGRLVRGVYRTSASGGQYRRFETLRGQLLLIEPSMVRQSTTHTFVSFPPFPAVLMLPFVALLHSGFSDVIFTTCVAGLDVALLFLLLELLTARGYSGRTRRENIALTLVFAFGTVHFWCSVLGQVWFTALVVGVALQLLYLFAALDARHPVWAGIWLGLGMATRTPLAFAALFFGLELIRIHRHQGRTISGDDGISPGWLRAALLFALPVLVIGGLLMIYNQVRFEQPFEFGHTYLAGGTIERIKNHGLFGLNFLPTNLGAAFLLLPVVTATAPFIRLSRHGMSLLLSTPPWLLFGNPVGRRPSVGAPAALRWGLVATVVAVALPIFLYQNTGHIQYGYRFSLDFTPLLILLLALSRQRLGRLFWVLALLGVLVNAFGAVTFKRMEWLYDDHWIRWPW